jgi:hypothetical protein
MSYRIVQYHLDDFISDCESVESSLNDACKRDHRQYRISGICQALNDRVVFVFEEDPSGNQWSYVVRPFSGETSADIVGEVHSRWQGKFSTKGLVQLSGTSLGIFERVTSLRQPVD